MKLIVNHDEPVVRFVDDLINNAIKNRISDIHIEPQENQCRIRTRQDGLLKEYSRVSLNFSRQMIARLKILAQMNIAESRLPQDGRITLDMLADIRASTCPTLFGEKMALRILTTPEFSPDIDQLGMTPPQISLLREALDQPQGLILVTGPTGSGKTMSLYAAINYLDTEQKNIMTVEDPIEIKLAGITQVNVHPSIGLSFASTLRAILRQDPDVIMIGEIRDKETALIALQAAQTGHLVLSTLHTNNVIESRTRLASLGVSADDLASSVLIVIAQRLVRKLQGETCLGRTGIFEFATPKPSHYQTISLWEAGMEKVRSGVTTLTELKRVLSSFEYEFNQTTIN